MLTSARMPAKVRTTSTTVKPSAAGEPSIVEILTIIEMISKSMTLAKIEMKAKASLQVAKV